ncbi:hypothetical protein OHA79_41480 [Streptomyces sp. NBC_00841]|nr:MULTISPECIES: hypothetical protein [unclassified Streptomyces]MCX4530520.1 hypothetical protein [Streptomyces sp. NBC_01669]WSA03723.1 hypothetical protein OHA79_41480 [Streptomyces sp. NBC_00841]
MSRTGLVPKYSARPGPAQPRPEAASCCGVRLRFIAPASRNTAASAPVTIHEKMFVDPHHFIQ